MRTTVSEKGQVTIPKALRDQLGIHPGAVLDFEAEGGRLVATRHQERDPFDAAFGVIALPDGTDAAVSALRDES